MGDLAKSNPALEKSGYVPVYITCQAAQLKYSRDRADISSHIVGELYAAQSAALG